MCIRRGNVVSRNMHKVVQIRICEYMHVYICPGNMDMWMHTCTYRCLDHTAHIIKPVRPDRCGLIYLKRLCGSDRTGEVLCRNLVRLTLGCPGLAFRPLLQGNRKKDLHRGVPRKSFMRFCENQIATAEDETAFRKNLMHRVILPLNYQTAGTVD